MLGTIGVADVAALAVFVGVGLFIKKAVDLVRYLSARDRSAVVTQLVVWILAITAMFVLAASDFADSFRIGTLLLSQMNGATLVIVGLSWGSGASFFGVDLLKAIDRNDTAAIPKLAIANAAPPPAPPPG